MCTSLGAHLFLGDVATLTMENVFMAYGHSNAVGGCMLATGQFILTVTSCSFQWHSALVGGFELFHCSFTRTALTSYFQVYVSQRR